MFASRVSSARSIFSLAPYSPTEWVVCREKAASPLLCLSFCGPIPECKTIMQISHRRSVVVKPHNSWVLLLFFDAQKVLTGPVFERSSSKRFLLRLTWVSSWCFVSSLFWFYSWYQTSPRADSVIRSAFFHFIHLLISSRMPFVFHFFIRIPRRFGSVVIRSLVRLVFISLVIESFGARRACERIHKLPAFGRLVIPVSVHIFPVLLTRQGPQKKGNWYGEAGLSDFLPPSDVLKAESQGSVLFV